MFFKRYFVPLHNQTFFCCSTNDTNYCQIIKMKKAIQWMLAAILICGPISFSSCSKDDNPIEIPARKNYFTKWNISMHDDFKTIYGEGVVKTDFTF